MEGWDWRLSYPSRVLGDWASQDSAPFPLSYLVEMDQKGRGELILCVSGQDRKKDEV